MDLILNRFKDLHQSQHLASISHSKFDVDRAKSLSNEDSFSLWYEVMPQEIHSTLFSFKPYKALKKDGCVLKAKYLTSRSCYSQWSSRRPRSRTWATCKMAKPILDSDLKKVANLPFASVYILHLLGKTSLGCSKLNTDDLVSPNSAYAGGGRLIRDSNGNWVRAFSRAKLWALRDGLLMTKSLRIEKLVVYVHAADKISLVSSSNSTNRLT
ncbi:hypothetical protein CFP56_020858 [Quercus suber]|uniref:RNase H type-1 domain-containing protein n=1 Tax=Quercus suber TaxID=58331 RepID=A0AAW0KEG1_QUESU